jgi:hypothetical protein
VKVTANRIRVSGKPKRDIDDDLLLQAILLIAEDRLRDLEAADGTHRADGEDQRESA